MRFLVAVAVLAVLVLAGVVTCDSDGDSIRRHGAKRILVLADDLSVSSSHSLFIQMLKNSGGTPNGNKVTVRRCDDPSLRLTEYGEYLHDSIVLMGCSSLRGRVSSKALTAFVDDGGSLVLVSGGTSGVSASVRDLAREFGADLQLGQNSVFDHFSVASADRWEGGDHTTIETDEIVANEVMAAIAGRKVVYKGVAQRMVNPSNKLASPVLRAEGTAYEAVAKGENAVAKAPPGDGLVLISAMQARNNARIVVAGSVAFFSDRFFGLKVKAENEAFDAAGNQELAAALVRWTLHDRGSLRVRDITHHKPGEAETKVYRIKDTLEFSMYIEEFSGGEWVPFTGEDVQLEFIMLDPYIRTTLKHDGKGKFHTTFKVPDTYGTFKIKIDHRRQGFSYIDISQQVTVRPYRHDEYERFIPAAFPYYINVGILMVSVFFMVTFVMYSEDDKNTDKKSKKE